MDEYLQFSGRKNMMYLPFSSYHEQSSAFCTFSILQRQQILCNPDSNMFSVQVSDPVCVPPFVLPFGI